jgi:hypothetical protein
MRFLVIYQDHVKAARELVLELGVIDVTVLHVTRGEQTPSRAYVEALGTNGDKREVAVVQVHRKYRRALESICNITCERKEFRREDKILRDWLRPAAAVSTASTLLPTVAFQNAAASQSRFILGDGALTHADDLRTERHPFANRAAVATSTLAGLKGGRTNKPLVDWFGDAPHRLTFAVNGRVSFKYEILSNGVVLATNETEWHLKEGDNTERLNCARVYFDKCRIADICHVVLLYCGPHPSEGRHFVTAHIPSTS